MQEVQSLCSPCPQITTHIDTDNKPTNLPSAEVIIAVAKAAYLNSDNCRGVPLVNKSTGGDVIAWIKFGPSATMAEARTQQYVAEVVNANDAAPVRVPSVYLSFESNGWGYIVMEYIDGVTCSKADATLVAAAVQFLVTITGPTLEPGPIGGGPICHDFFYGGESSVVYSSAELLEKHINGILELTGRPDRVSFSSEVEKHGLYLCLSDMNISNFMKDRTNKIVALDFGATCFLPVCFFDLALYHHDPFTQILRFLIKRPKSNQLNALLAASHSLVLCGTNNIRVPSKLKETAK